MRLPEVFVFIQACERDLPLAIQSAESIRRLRVDYIPRIYLAIDDTFAPEWECPVDWLGVFPRPKHERHWGWDNSVGALRSLRLYADEVEQAPCGKPGDVIVRLDADTFIGSREVLDFARSNPHSICGFPHESAESPYPRGRHGRDWRHLSGFFLSMPTQAARSIAELAWTDSRADDLGEEMRRLDVCRNEDVAISYAAGIAGVPRTAVPRSLTSADFEQDVASGEYPSKLYHLNIGDLRSFLGVPVTGKWDIPAAVREYRLRFGITW